MTIMSPDRFFGIHFVQAKVDEIPTGSLFLTDKLREFGVGVPHNAVRTLDAMRCVSRHTTATPTSNTIVWKRDFSPRVSGKGSCTGCIFLDREKNQSGCVIYANAK